MSNSGFVGSAHLPTLKYVFFFNFLYSKKPLYPMPELRISLLPGISSAAGWAPAQFYLSMGQIWRRMSPTTQHLLTYLHFVNVTDIRDDSAILLVCVFLYGVSRVTFLVIFKTSYTDMERIPRYRASLWLSNGKSILQCVS